MMTVSSPAAASPMAANRTTRLAWACAATEESPPVTSPPQVAGAPVPRTQAAPGISVDAVRKRSTAAILRRAMEVLLSCLAACEFYGGAGDGQTNGHFWFWAGVPMIIAGVQ